MVTLIYTPQYLLHNKGLEHPESPQRLAVILRALKNSSLKDSLRWLKPLEIKEEEVLPVHTASYINLLKSLSLLGGGWIDEDTFVSPPSFGISLLAVGGTVRALLTSVEENIPSFALVRPPGHHAKRDRGAGFCLLNNVACAVKYLQRKEGLKKILIVDWDLHHGDGTQEIFYEDPSVLYFSLHQYPWYPGTGRVEEKGSKAGEGFTVNVPLPAGCGDEEYITVFMEILVPIAEQFSPELIVVSAGFDAHFADPLGRMVVSPLGYFQLTNILKELSNELCGGRLAFVLEGGYDPDGLSSGVLAVIGALEGWKTLEGKEELSRGPQVGAEVHRVIERVKEVHSKYWKF